MLRTIDPEGLLGFGVQDLPDKLAEIEKDHSDAKLMKRIKEGRAPSGGVGRAPLEMFSAHDSMHRTHEAMMHDEYAASAGQRWFKNVLSLAARDDQMRKEMGMDKK